MSKRKIVIPFHRGQKIHIGNSPDGDSILDYNCDAIVNEVMNDLYYPEYSLIIFDKNGKEVGGGAWYPHKILTLIEEVTIKNLLLLDKTNGDE